jgi:hypothetical protein
MTGFSEDNLPDSAAALTYYAVLSIFPALLAMVSIVGLGGDTQTMTRMLTDIIGSIGPKSAVYAPRGPGLDHGPRHGFAAATEADRAKTNPRRSSERGR